MTPANEDRPADAEPRARVQSAARAIGILLAIAQSDSGLTAREISDRVGIGRQATYHLLHTLTSTGMVMRNGSNRYVLGLRVGTLAEGFKRQLTPSAHLDPIVRAAAHETGEMAYAAGWWGGEIMALTFARGANPIQAIEVPQGYVGVAHARASGKVLLAFAPPAVRDAYLDAHPPTKVTAHTITTRKALERELTAVREQGYATDLEEFRMGLCCLAVPLDDGYSPFTLGIAVPRERFAHEKDRYIEVLLRLAELGRANAPVGS